jgi:DNA modification methylase
MLKLQKKTIYETLGRESVHPFPARMAPGIALQVIAEAKKPLRILDPMMGSGTVVALARAKGHKAVGVDIDPLAVLISKTWTTAADVEAARTKAREVLARARRIFSSLTQKQAYPRGADPETRQFIAYWFDGYARRQLAALSLAIGSVKDKTTSNILLCALSRLIITKSSGVSLAMDLSHSRPHKVFKQAPIKPFRKFLAAVDRVADNCVHQNHANRGPAPRVHLGDARALPVSTASIDLVLTSPPYLNAIDYIRCSKFSLVWMGYRIPDLRLLRTESVGNDVGNSVSEKDPEIQGIVDGLRLGSRLLHRDRAALAHYIDDMRNAMRETARVLVPGGIAVYVIGENTVRGTFIRNARILLAVAKLCGLKFDKQHTRSLPANRRYLPPPSGEKRSAPLDTRMRREVILKFHKPRSRKH